MKRPTLHKLIFSILLFAISFLALFTSHKSSAFADWYSSTDHPYMELYRNQKAVICCGQGAWEQPDTTWYLKRIFEAKGIPVWVDLWGHDVKHDWDWWYKQVVYYMPYVLGE